MKRLDTITLDFARQVIEEETGAPLDIPTASAGAAASLVEALEGGAKSSGLGNDTRLIARDDKKNPLISTFDWTNDAVQRIFRVPAGFMRNKTQERVEELARERGIACRAEASGGGGIDLALVEDGIEFGKKMMAEMISTYTNASTSSPSVIPAVAKPAPAQEPPSGGDYLNEVRSR
jgi:hypothetical protein